MLTRWTLAALLTNAGGWAYALYCGVLWVTWPLFLSGALLTVWSIALAYQRTHGDGAPPRGEG